MNATPCDRGAARRIDSQQKEDGLLRWGIVFLVFALIAGVFGFSGLAGESMYIARILFFVFIVLFLGGLVFNLVVGRRAA